MIHPGPYMIYLMLCMIILGLLILLIEKLIMRYFIKKEKPEKSGILCPLDPTRKLMDYELHFGHCKGCPLSQQKACGADIKKQIENESNGSVHL